MREKPRFSGRFRNATLIVAEQCYGAKGVWAYKIYEFVNEHFFYNHLPWPHIIWGLTAHGGCLAWSSTALDKSRPPVILMHDSLLGTGTLENPWGIPKSWLGPCFVFDAMIHECIHVHINYNLGGHRGRTSHDSARWARQVNRLIPLLGFPKSMKAGKTMVKRVPDPTLPKTVRGKQGTRIARVGTGNIPLTVSAGFPYSLRAHLGTAEDHYLSQTLPATVPNLRGFS